MPELGLVEGLLDLEEQEREAGEVVLRDLARRLAPAPQLHRLARALGLAPPEVHAPPGHRGDHELPLHVELEVAERVQPPRLGGPDRRRRRRARARAAR